MTERREQESFGALFEQGAGGRRERRRFQIGDRIEVTIVVVAQNAVFADLGGKQEGYFERIELTDVDGKLVVEVGHKVSATVAAIDRATGQVRLSPVSVRNNEGEPLTTSMGIGAKGQSPVLMEGARVKGSVTGIERYGVFVQIAGTQGRSGRGLVPSQETGTARGADLKKHFTVGQEVDAKIVNIEQDGKIRLSISAIARGRRAKLVREVQGRRRRRGPGGGGQTQGRWEEAGPGRQQQEARAARVRDARRSALQEDEEVNAREPVRVACVRLRPDVALPAYQSAGAVGLDLRAAIDDEIVIAPGERRLVPTGLSIAIPEGFEGQVRPRSGLALKHGITVLNAPGTIDPDYRGEVMVLLVNHGDAPFTVRRGERVAQLVVCPVAKAELVVVDSLDETARGGGGYGSTGT